MAGRGLQLAAPTHYNSRWIGAVNTGAILVAEAIHKDEIFTFQNSLKFVYLPTERLKLL